MAIIISLIYNLKETGVTGPDQKGNTFWAENGNNLCQNPAKKGEKTG